MAKRLLGAVVGLAMGGLVGLVGALLGGGNTAVIVGGILGAIIFFAAPGARESRAR